MSFEWSRLTDEPDPSGISIRKDHAACWHALSGHALLLGGGYDTQFTFDGEVPWELISPDPKPGLEFDALMAYASQRHRIVIVCGNGSKTYEYDGASFYEIETAIWPGDMRRMMAYLPSTDRVYKFAVDGGAPQTKYYDGADWIDLSTAHAPSARVGGYMCFDPNIDKIILYGGTHFAGGGQLNDIWALDGIDWEQLSPSTVPPPRADHVLIFDENYGYPLLIGGLWYDGGEPRSTTGIYAWKIDDWSTVVEPEIIYSGDDGTEDQRSVARWKAAAFYDPVQKGIVIQGGTTFGPYGDMERSDSWLLSYAKPRDMSYLRGSYRSRTSLPSGFCHLINNRKDNEIDESGHLVRDYTPASRCFFRLVCKRGLWQADTECGSRFYTIDSLKDAKAKCPKYAQEALQPLIDEGIILGVSVGEVVIDDELGRLGIPIDIIEPDGQIVSLGVLPLGSWT